MTKKSRLCLKPCTLKVIAPVGSKYVLAISALYISNTSVTFPKVAETILSIATYNCADIGFLSFLIVFSAFNSGVIDSALVPDMDESPSVSISIIMCLHQM